MRKLSPSIRVKRKNLGAVCISYNDIPQIKYNERQVSIPEKTYRDRTVLT